MTLSNEIKAHKYQNLIIYNFYHVFEDFVCVWIMFNLVNQLQISCQPCEAQKLIITKIKESVKISNEGFYLGTKKVASV